MKPIIQKVHVTRDCQDMPFDHATAFWIQAPGKGALICEPLAAPRAGEVKVRARFGMISRGTELLFYRGLVPPSEYERMRAPVSGGFIAGAGQVRLCQCWVRRGRSG